MRVDLLVLLSISFFTNAAAVFPSSAITIPIIKRSNVTASGVVDRDNLNRQVSKVISKVERGFDAYQRNTGSPHPSSGAAVQRKRGIRGDIPLTDDQGQLWQGSLAVGTPPVMFTVDFDTGELANTIDIATPKSASGSSDLFLPGTNCATNCDGHKLYDTKASSSSRDQEQTFSLAFGDGSTVEGEIFTDKVSIGGLTATNQSVGSSTQYSPGFAIDQFPPDGLLGLAFLEIAQFGLDPLFESLVAQKQTKDSVFAFKLSESGASLSLGGVDPNLFTGQFTQNPVTQVGFWQINLNSVNVAGKPAVTGLQGIIDSGTTLVLGDSVNVAKLYAAIPGSKNASATVGEGFFTVPCDAIPDISFTFADSRAFTMSPETFNLGSESESSSDCVGSIAAADLGEFWVVGDAFMQNVYTSFDVGKKQVGFATLK
ncbi:acid protease [Mycena floridula]|nr:acid protease [Mycena floridula]